MKTFRSLVLVVLLSSCGAPALEPSAETGAAQAELELGAFRPRGRVGTHGMIAVGEPGEHYLSHVPMFHAPHDVQAVFRVTFSPSVASLSNRLHTIRPATLSLDDLVLGKLTDFSATLYDGNFEAGGQPIAQVQVHVDRVVRAVALKGSTPPATSLRYFAFGSRAHLFLLHAHTGSPGFDQVLSAKWLSGASISDQVLASGVLLDWKGHSDDATKRPRSGTLELTGVTSAQSARVQVQKELSALEGPDFFNALP